MTAAASDSSSTFRSTTLPLAIDGGLTTLLPYLQPSGAWIREGDGMIGLGVAAEHSARGSDRFAQLASWWDSLHFEDTTAAEAEVASFSEGTSSEFVQGSSSDAAYSPGPTAFVSISYSSESRSASSLVLPQVIIGQDGTSTWATIISPASPNHAGTAESLAELFASFGLRAHSEAAPVANPAGDSVPDLHRVTISVDPTRKTEPTIPPLRLEEGSHPEKHYLKAVESGTQAIAGRRLEKLVLARDAVVMTEAPEDRIPTGTVLSKLASSYASCWTYLAGNVLGATPEMLVKVRGDRLSARVLAGTLDREDSGANSSAKLLHDPKQRNEHQIAVKSLLEQLAPIAENLEAPEVPEVLKLPNVYHLSTDVEGTLAPHVRISPLLVAERAHPTAAICGTPTATAAELITALEQIDRGAYAGPVGWIDHRGNADFGIALRGGVLEEAASQVRLFAGCGIVSGSEPESELAETWAKMRPMMSALDV